MWRTSASLDEITPSTFIVAAKPTPLLSLLSSQERINRTYMTGSSPCTFPSKYLVARRLKKLRSSSVSPLFTGTPIEW
jgi:hypothetical protein